MGDACEYICKTSTNEFANACTCSMVSEKDMGVGVGEVGVKENG